MAINHVLRASSADMLDGFVYMSSLGSGMFGRTLWFRLMSWIAIASGFGGFFRLNRVLAAC